MKKEIKFEEVTYFVSKPKAEDEAQARLKQSKVFNEALQGGACLKSQLNKVLRERKVWDESDQKEVDELSKKVEDNIEKLNEGGFDIMEARELAIQSYNLRMALLEKLSIIREHNSLTAEGQADDAYFDALVARCCFKEDGSKVFKSYEDYISKSKEPYASFLAKELSTLIYGDLDYIKEFPENKFLQEFGFIDDDMNFIDEEGNKVDSKYQKIVEEEKPVRKPFLKNGQPIDK